MTQTTRKLVYLRNYGCTANDAKEQADEKIHRQSLDYS